MEYSKKQSDFIESVKNGENVFLTGKAGTGKSFIVKEAIEILKLQYKNIVAVAPTGIAAYNIGGQTMHSFFSLPVDGVINFESCRFVKQSKRKIFKKLDVIFIDEISMLRPDHLDAINWTLIKNGCGSLKEKKIIFVGDLKQLPAPMDDNFLSVLLTEYESFEFLNAKVYDKLEVKEIELDFIHRQSDDEFIENLNIVREGNKSDYFKKFVTKEPKGIILAPHNSTVSKYNAEGLKLIDSEEITYKANIDGDVKYSDFNVDPIIKVKNGCKIMYLSNSKNNNLTNGTLGIFILKHGEPYIRVGINDYLIEKKEFKKVEYVLNEKTDELELMELGSITQYPIKLAYAMTIHKSQGLTFDEVTIDLSLPCFSKGQLYTSLSRVKDPKGLRLIINR